MSESGVDVLPELIRSYKEALDSALALEPNPERSLYVKHKAALEELESLIANSASVESIRTLLYHERRSFGWAYLPGDHGLRVESAFNELANSLEHQMNS